MQQYNAVCCSFSRIIIIVLNTFIKTRNKCTRIQNVKNTEIKERMMMRLQVNATNPTLYFSLVLASLALSRTAHSDTSCT